MTKYDEISVYTLTYIDKHMTYTDEELEALRNKPGSRNINSNLRSEFTIQESTPDV